MKTFKIWLDENFDVLQRDPAGIKALNSQVDQFEVQSQSANGHEIIFGSDVFVEDLKYPMTYDRQETINGVENYFYKFEMVQATLPTDEQDYEMSVQIVATSVAILPIVQSTIPMPYKVLHQLNGAIVLIPQDVITGINDRLTNVEINKWDKVRGASNQINDILDTDLVNIMQVNNAEAVMTFAELRAKVQPSTISATFATRTDLFTALPPELNDPTDPAFDYANMTNFVEDWEGDGTNDKIAGWNGTTWFNTETAPQVTRDEFDANVANTDANTARINTIEDEQLVQDSLINDNRVKSEANELQIGVNTNKNTEQDARLTATENATTQNAQDIDTILNNDLTGLNSKIDKSSIDTQTLSSTDTTRVAASPLVESLLATKPDSLIINGTSGYLSLSNLTGTTNPTNPTDFIVEGTGGGGSGTIYNLAVANVDYDIVEDAPAIVLNYPTTEESTDETILLWEYTEVVPGTRVYNGVARLGSPDTLYRVEARGEVNKGGQQDAEFIGMAVDADTGQMIGDAITQSIDADNDSSTYNFVFNISSTDHARVRVEVRSTGNDLVIASATTNQIQVSTTGQSSGTMLKAVYDQDGNDRVDNADFGSYQLTTNYADTDNTNAALLRTDSLFGNFLLTEDRNGDPYASTQEGLNKTRNDIGDVNSVVVVENSTDLAQAIVTNWNLSRENEAKILNIEAEITRPDIKLTQLADSEFTRQEEATLKNNNMIITSEFGSHKQEVYNREIFQPNFDRIRSTTLNFTSDGSAEYEIEFDQIIGNNPAYMVENSHSIRVVENVVSENIELVGKVLNFDNLTPNRFLLRLTLTRNGVNTNLTDTPINEFGDIEIEVNGIALVVDDLINATIVDTNPTGDMESITFDQGLSLFVQHGNHRGYILPSIETLTYAEWMANLENNRVYENVPYSTSDTFSTTEMDEIINENWPNDNVGQRYTNIQMISTIGRNTGGNDWTFIGTFEVQDTFINQVEEVVGRIEFVNGLYSFKFNGQVRPEPLDLRYLGITANGTQVATEFEKWFGGENNRNGFGFNLDTIVGEYIAKIRVWDGGATYHTNGNLENNSLSADIGESKGRLEITNGSTTILTPLQSRLSGADPQQDSDFATKRYVDSGVQEAKDYSDEIRYEIVRIETSSTNINYSNPCFDNETGKYFEFALQDGDVPLLKFDFNMGRNSAGNGGAFASAWPMGFDARSGDEFDGEPNTGAFWILESTTSKIRIGLKHTYTSRNIYGCGCWVMRKVITQIKKA